jgi:hypothetical protein
MDPETDLGKYLEQLGVVIGTANEKDIVSNSSLQSSNSVG